MFVPPNIKVPLVCIFSPFQNVGFWLGCHCTAHLRPRTSLSFLSLGRGHGQRPRIGTHPPHSGRQAGRQPCPQRRQPAAVKFLGLHVNFDGGEAPFLIVSLAQIFLREFLQRLSSRFISNSVFHLVLRCFMKTMHEF